MYSYALERENIVETRKDNIVYLFGEPETHKKEVCTYGDKNNPLTSTGKPKAQAACAIRELEDIKRISNYFLTTGRIEWVRLRNNMMFVVGICTGLRISDLLSLKIKDILTIDGIIRDTIVVYEQKTNKINHITITDTSKKVIREYLDCIGSFNSEDYLFKSNKGSMLDTRSAHKILKTMSRDLELPYNIGTHTLRKTFAYWTIKLHSNDGEVLSALQKLLNHSDQRITFAYADIDKEKQIEMYNDISDYLF